MYKPAALDFAGDADIKHRHVALLSLEHGEDDCISRKLSHHKDKNSLAPCRNMPGIKHLIKGHCLLPTKPILNCTIDTVSNYLSFEIKLCTQTYAYICFLTFKPTTIPAWNWSPVCYLCWKTDQMARLRDVSDLLSMIRRVQTRLFKLAEYFYNIADYGVNNNTYTPFHSSSITNWCSCHCIKKT